MNERMRQLLSLAASGNEDAVGDLWLEFEYNYEREEVPMEQ